MTGATPHAGARSAGNMPARCPNWTTPATPLRLSRPGPYSFHSPTRPPRIRHPPALVAQTVVRVSHGEPPTELPHTDIRRYRTPGTKRFAPSRIGQRVAIVRDRSADASARCCCSIARATASPPSYGWATSAAPRVGRNCCCLRSSVNSNRARKWSSAPTRPSPSGGVRSAGRTVREVRIRCKRSSYLGAVHVQHHPPGAIDRFRLGDQLPMEPAYRRVDCGASEQSDDRMGFSRDVRIERSGRQRFDLGSGGHEPQHWPIGRTSFHKEAYLATSIR